MWTESPPRTKELLRQFDASDAAVTLPLPPAEPLHEASEALREALAAGATPSVRVAGQRILDGFADFYRVRSPKLKVLGVRPHDTHEGRLSYELFGDYDLETAVIRGWMRTAMRGKVTSHRGFLNTLIHELCHHLDVHAFGWPSTPHTRGFYGRIDELYHLALATPPDARRPLVWIPSRKAWRIDWTKLRAPRSG